VHHCTGFSHIQKMNTGITKNSLLYLSYYNDWLWDEWPGFNSWKRQKFLSSQSYPDWFWGSSNLISIGYQDSFPTDSPVTCNWPLILHLVLRLRMDGAVPSLLHMVLTVWCLTKYRVNFNLPFTDTCHMRFKLTTVLQWYLISDFNNFKYDRPLTISNWPYKSTF